METFNVAKAERVYVYDEPVNMSKSFDGLTEIVEKKLGKKIVDGDLFLFFNKSRTYVKILFWARNGLCIFAKRIPSLRFEFDGMKDSITIKEMQSVLNVLQKKKPTLKIDSK